MTSHEYAAQLRELAALLEAVEPFTLPDYENVADVRFSYFGEKEPFLAAVRSVGSGEKRWKDATYFEFRKTLPSGAYLNLSVNRSAVCRKVQEEKWECEPLLSTEEFASIGGTR